MLVSTLSNEIPFQGPIALERALFCLDCEVVFTGLMSCPSCSGRVVWPLALWLSPAQPSPLAESKLEACPPMADHGAQNARAVS